jgi:hypothetical protein
MFTRKPRLQLEKFAINGAKRLLQHNLISPTLVGHMIPLPMVHRFEVQRTLPPRSTAMESTHDPTRRLQLRAASPYD